MDLRKTKTSYAIDMDMTDFAILSKSDGLRWDGPTLEDKDLPEGVYDLEFNGHFGASVYYTVDAVDDTLLIHAAMVALIEDRVEAIRTFMGDPDG